MKTEDMEQEEKRRDDNRCEEKREKTEERD